VGRLNSELVLVLARLGLQFLLRLGFELADEACAAAQTPTRSLVCCAADYVLGLSAWTL
jgi:hypothetical protein